MSIAITLRQILDAGPCYDPRNKGLLPPNHNLDEPISFREIVEKAGAEDAIWCFSILPGNEGLKRHFAVDCAERVKHLMKNERILNVLTVARRHAIGHATDEELAVASAAYIAAAESSDSGEERAWQAARLIELTEAGEWSPVKPFC